MCEKRRTLRVLVNERLTAAAEEIFALVERTIAEYEEELCRSKEENQRNQQLLDSVLKTQLLHTTADAEIQTERSKDLKEEAEKSPEFSCVIVKHEGGEEEEPAQMEPDEWSAAAVQTAKGCSDVDAADGDAPEKTDKSPIAKRRGRPSVRRAKAADPGGAPEFPPLCQSHGNAEGNDKNGSGSEIQTRSSSQETREIPQKDPTAAAQNAQIKTETTSDGGLDLRDLLCAHSLLRQSQTEPEDWPRDWEPQAAASSQIPDSDDEDYTHRVQNLSAEMLRASQSGVASTACDDEGKVKHECPVCKKKLGRKQELKRHMLLHTGERPFSCPVCDKRFIQKSNLKSHIVTHLDSVDTIIRHQRASEAGQGETSREGASEACRDEVEGEVGRSEAGRSEGEAEQRDKLLGHFSESENEDDWMRLMAEAPGSSSARHGEEDGEEDGEEEDSGVTTSLERIGFLLNQALNESKERKVTEYKCPICDKAFGRMENLRRHVLVHTGEKAFSCPVCAKPFTLKQHLKLHMVLHTRDKQFDCSVCAKTFLRKDNLRSHMRIHSAERPFGCSQCGARFFSDQDLERHKAVHGADRPFVCSVCSARFLTRRHLTRHEKIHKKEAQKSK